jgi:hypothetical protein
LRDGEEDGGKNRYGKVLAEPKELIEFGRNISLDIIS